MEINKTTSKDQIIFIEKTDLAKPLSEHSKLIENLAENDPSNPGVIMPNGSINWGCPCLGTASIGPCSKFFRAAFKCFHYSEAEIKGTDCLNEFEKLQNCMKKYPSLYNN